MTDAAADAELDAACAREVHALHDAFEDWFAGRTPPDGFTRIERALADDFRMVPPSGALLDRDALLAALRAAHGTHAAGSLRLRVSDVVVEALGPDLRRARYVEHHEGARPCRRRSTALLRRDADAPGGVRWLDVHETWLEGHAPPRDR